MKMPVARSAHDEAMALLRAAYDARVADLKEQVALLTADRNGLQERLDRALDYIGMGSNGIPIFSAARVAAKTARAEDSEEEDQVGEADPNRVMPTMVQEAREHGFRRARDVQRIADKRAEEDFLQANRVLEVMEAAQEEGRKAAAERVSEEAAA